MRVVFVRGDEKAADIARDLIQVYLCVAFASTCFQCFVCVLLHTFSAQNQVVHESNATATRQKSTRFCVVFVVVEIVIASYFWSAVRNTVACR